MVKQIFDILFSFDAGRGQMRVTPIVMGRDLHLFGNDGTSDSTKGVEIGVPQLGGCFSLEPSHVDQ